MKQGPKYEAKRDFLVFLVVMTLIVAIACIAVFFPKNYFWQYIFLLVFFSVILLVYLYSVLKTYYIFTEDYLLVVSGIFRKRIYYRYIEEVKSVKSIVSSFCLSIDRIKIKRGSKFFQRDYIAPVDKEEVMAELKERATKAREFLNK